MTAPAFMRRGASLVHLRRPDDTAEGFAHSICGLSFAKAVVCGHPQVIELDEPVTCEECIAVQDKAERERMLAALPIPVFTPRPSADDAMAWMGPQVEVLRVTDLTGRHDVTVFLDGIEVPLAHLTVADVDPRHITEREAWEAQTRDVMGDVTMTSSFRSLLVQERNYALHKRTQIFPAEPGDPADDEGDPMAPNHALEDPGSWCYYCDFEPQYNRDGVLENEDDAEHCPASPDGQHHDPNTDPSLLPDAREQALAEAAYRDGTEAREKLFSQLFNE